MPEPITDDQRDLVSEVREALAKAAEAQRRIEADKGRLRIGASHDAAVLHEFRDRAPEWLAALCEQVERLNDEVVREQMERSDAIIRAEAAEAAVKRVRALAEYAVNSGMPLSTKALLTALDGE